MKQVAQAGLLFAAMILALAPAMGQRVSGAHRVMVYRVPQRAMITHPALRPMPARPAIGQTSGAQPARRGVASTRTQIGGHRFQVYSGSLSHLGQVLNPVPGLGFDYVHMAAINRDLAVKALIDPVTQQEVAEAERLFRSRGIATGGFALFEPETVAVNGAPQAQPIIVIEQPQSAPRREEASGNRATSSSAPTRPAPPEPPLPDVGSFTLVLKDGTQVKASAFGRQSDDIVYITPQGVRKSFPAATLDVAATEKVNQEHGTPLRLSFGNTR